MVNRKLYVRCKVIFGLEWFRPLNVDRAGAGFPDISISRKRTEATYFIE